MNERIPPESILLDRLASSQAFLKEIDPRAKKFTFQTFDDVQLPDGKKRGKKELVQCFDATLQGTWKPLLRGNSRGAGVYYTPNQTRLNGKRRNNEIMSRRACWFDWDRADKPLPEFPLEPSLKVNTSPGKFQLLWLMEGGLLTVPDFKAIMQAMVGLGSDPAAIAQAQVLRLPGTFHMKREPYEVTWEYGATVEHVVAGPTGADGKLVRKARRYTSAEMLAAFVGAEAQTTEESQQRSEPGQRGQQQTDNSKWQCTPDNEHDVARAIEYLKSLAEVPEGKRNKAAYEGPAVHLKDLGISADKSAELMVAHWRTTLDSDEIRKVCKNAHKSGQRPPGCELFEQFLRDYEDVIGDPWLKEFRREQEEELKKKQRPPLVWPVKIGKGDKERPDPNSLKNVKAFLKHLHVTVRLDEFSREHTVKGLRGHTILNDSALRFLWAVARAQGLGCSWDAFVRLVFTAGDRNRYHAVKDYLRALKWDGRPRLDTWLSTYAGAEKSELNSHFGRVFLLGAVKRVIEPGCKFDYALVLEDERQGTGKSSLVQILGGKWYGDSLKLGMDAKETIERTCSVWIQEVPELGGMQNREVEAIKAQITTRSDRARMAYGRTTEVVPRQFVLFCTTNDETHLKDRTGNRRFLPVRAGKIDLKALARDRDQLWAEACQRANAGESTVLPEAMWELAREAQDKRVVVDPIKERLTELLDGVTGRVLKEDIWIAIGRPNTASRTQTEKNQLTTAMRELGWTPGKKWHKKMKRECECYLKASAEWRELTGDHAFSHWESG